MNELRTLLRAVNAEKGATSLGSKRRRDVVKKVRAGVVRAPSAPRDASRWTPSPPRARR